MNRSTWNLSQHYAAVQSIITTVIALPMNVFSANATYLQYCMLLLFDLSVCLPCYRPVCVSFYSVVCGFKDVKK